MIRRPVVIFNQCGRTAHVMCAKQRRERKMDKVDGRVGFCEIAQVGLEVKMSEGGQIYHDPETGNDIDDMLNSAGFLKLADKDKYEAKTKGKLTVVVDNKLVCHKVKVNKKFAMCVTPKLTITQLSKKDAKELRKQGSQELQNMLNMRAAIMEDSADCAEDDDDDGSVTPDVLIQMVIDADDDMFDYNSEDDTDDSDSDPEDDVTGSDDTHSPRGTEDTDTQTREVAAIEDNSITEDQHSSDLESIKDLSIS